MTTWATFWAKLLPILIAFGRELYDRHRGDAVTARAELVELIRKHRTRWDDTRARNDAHMAELRRQAEAEPAKKE